MDTLTNKKKMSKKKNNQATSKKKDSVSSDDTTDFKTCDENSDSFVEKSPDFVFKHRKEKIDDDVFDKLFSDGPSQKLPVKRVGQNNSSGSIDSSSLDYLSLKSKSSSISAQSPRLFKTFEGESFEKPKKTKQKKKRTIQVRQVTRRAKKTDPFRPTPFLSDSSVIRISKYLNRARSGEFDLRNSFQNKEEGIDDEKAPLRNASMSAEAEGSIDALSELSPVKATNLGAKYSTSLIEDSSVAPTSTGPIQRSRMMITSTPSLTLTGCRSMSKLLPIQTDFRYVSKDLFDDLTEKAEIIDKINKLSITAETDENFKSYANPTENAEASYQTSIQKEQDYSSDLFASLDLACRVKATMPDVIESKERISLRDISNLAVSKHEDNQHCLPRLSDVATHPVRCIKSDSFLLQQGDLSKDNKCINMRPGKLKHRHRTSFVVRLKRPSWSKPLNRCSSNVNTYRRRFTHQPIFEFDPRQLIISPTKKTETFSTVIENPEESSDGRQFLSTSARRARVHLSSSYIISILNNDSCNVSLNEISINKSVESTSVLEMVMKRCKQTELLDMKSIYEENILKESKKIGEGAFGEVFLLATDSSPVLKIVPVDGSALVNDQPQTKLSDMLAEIIVTTELSSLANVKRGQAQAANFVEVRNCYITQGDYPEALLHLWDEFDAEKGSENDRPDSNLFGGQSVPQKFVVLEFSNGGDDLEHAELRNAAQGLAVFMQVIHSLAVAETLLEFEHRDLHWGNILVRESAINTLAYSICGESYEIKTHGVIATIIDFSLSRLTLPNDDCKIFNNLAEDEDLFTATGEEYQFEIYRLMRQHTGNEWQEFYPKTNVLWMHYLLDKLCSMVTYKNKKSKIHNSAMATLRSWKAKILEYQSCTEFVQSTCS